MPSSFATVPRAIGLQTHRGPDWQHEQAKKRLGQIGKTDGRSEKHAGNTRACSRRENREDETRLDEEDQQRVDVIRRAAPGSEIDGEAVHGVKRGGQ